MVALEHMTELERDFFRRDLVRRVQNTTTDYLKTKKDNPGAIIFELHHPKFNIARRRRGKSSYFSSKA